jgi:hypothetical protein
MNWQNPKYVPFESREHDLPANGAEIESTGRILS